MTARDDLADVLMGALIDRAPNGSLWIHTESLHPLRQHLADAVIRQWLPTQTTAIEADAEDQRGGYRVAAEAADRFRDVLSECLGHDDENPGDDVLVTELRAHFGKAGPEPRRWRDFLTGALAIVDQINADHPDYREALGDA